jgi:hypothetical protein
MIAASSGVLYRFKLDFNLGYGFAEYYDFTDVSTFDGHLVFVYNRIDANEQKQYVPTEITSSGIGLGPIHLYEKPNTKGKGAWKQIGQANSFIMDSWPITKSAPDLVPWVHNWNTLQRWHTSGWHPKEGPVYVPYHEVRSLETRILNSTLSIVKKATMKKLIYEGKNVADYYDLSQLGTCNSYVQLINTYYPLEVTEQLITQIPTGTEKGV